MATTAAYIPVVGNYKPEDGFFLRNAAGDDVPRANIPTFGPGRPGLFKFGLTLLVFGGPVGDDAKFTLRVPHPVKFKPEILATNVNFYYPTGSVQPGRPGSTAQDLYVNNVILHPEDNTIEFDIQFGSPEAALFVSSLYFDFCHSLTE